MSKKKFPDVTEEKKKKGFTVSVLSVSIFEQGFFCLFLSGVISGSSVSNDCIIHQGSLSRCLLLLFLLLRVSYIRSLFPFNLLV